MSGFLDDSSMMPLTGLESWPWQEEPFTTHRQNHTVSPVAAIVPFSQAILGLPKGKPPPDPAYSHPHGLKPEVQIASFGYSSEFAIAIPSTWGPPVI
jgi:hypothetical protein